ncbi:hypothetical protein FNV43_RR00661 [Rhamnella rubrinervis]|uniref:DUF1985 domain-containing protein n=1 Tax=Rhamnella rubrinervis TaxID=2594499 RepID=A0A8K0HQ03_9ROSA|nr:hypothetical protein FNV43_RR00661 [Rhamnella rubrinervis]
MGMEYLFFNRAGACHIATPISINVKIILVIAVVHGISRRPLLESSQKSFNASALAVAFTISTQVHDLVEAIAKLHKSTSSYLGILLGYMGMDIPISVRRFHDSEFKRHMVNLKSTLTKNIEDIKNKLRDHQLLKFKDSCFGHFLDIDELMFSGQIVNHMLYKQSNCNDDDSNDDDRLKLALLFFLETVVLSKAHKSTTEPNHMEMVDDLKFFNSYPWGTSSFNVTIRSLHAAFEHRCSKTSNNSHTYNIIGFPMPFMIWGFESIPDLAAAYGVKNTQIRIPRILNWKIIHTPNYKKLENERAFVSSIAWPVKESRYPGPPIVRDKTLSPNGHNNTCTTAIKEKKRKKTKVAIDGSKKARRIGIPVFTSPLSRKSPFVCRDRSSADSSHRRKSHDIPKLSSIVQKLSHLEDEMTGLRGQVTQLNTKVFSIEDRLSHIEDMITRVETKECAVYDKIPGLETMLSKILGLLQEARPTVQVDDDSQRPHNSDREQPDLDDVHGAYDDDGHKANFDDATGYATNDVRIDESEDVEKQSNKDVRGDSTLVDKQLLFSPILSPHLQSTPHGQYQGDSRQVSSGDCGIFVLKYMEYLSAGRDMDFTSNDISFFRMKFTLKERRTPDISPEVKPDDIGFQTTFNLGHVKRLTYRLMPCQAPDISPEVKPDDIGFQTTFNLCHVGRLTYRLSDYLLGASYFQFNLFFWTTMGRSRRIAQVGDQGPSSSRSRTRASGPVRSVWDRDRLGSCMCLEGKFYPRLVREFYANIEDKEDSAVHRVVTYVKGCRIDLDRATIARILGVSDDGPYVEFYKDAVLSDRQYKLVQALGRLNYSPTRNNRTADMGIDGVPFASVVISHISDRSKWELLDVLLEANLYRMGYVRAWGLAQLSSSSFACGEEVMEAQCGVDGGFTDSHLLHDYAFLFI